MVREEGEEGENECVGGTYSVIPTRRHLHNHKVIDIATNTTPHLKDSRLMKFSRLTFRSSKRNITKQEHDLPNHTYLAISRTRS